MSQIEDAMDGLMTAIRNSEEFIRYQAIKEKVHGFPKLESQITEFRKKNYLLQNSQGTVDLYEETDRMENEYREEEPYGVRVSCSRKCTLQNCAADQLDFDRGTGI